MIVKLNRSIVKAGDRRANQNLFHVKHDYPNDFEKMSSRHNVIVSVGLKTSTPFFFIHSHRQDIL